MNDNDSIKGGNTRTAKLLDLWGQAVGRGESPTVRGMAREAGLDATSARRALRKAGLIESPPDDVERALAKKAKRKPHATHKKAAPVTVSVAAAVFEGAQRAGVSVRDASAGIVLAAIVEGQRDDIRTARESASDLLLQVREIARPAQQPDGQLLIDPARVAQGVMLLDKLANALDRLHGMERDSWGIEKGGKPPAEDAAGKLSELATAVRQAAIAAATATNADADAIDPA